MVCTSHLHQCNQTLTLTFSLWCEPCWPGRWVWIYTHTHTHVHVTQSTSGSGCFVIPTAAVHLHRHMVAMSTASWHWSQYTSLIWKKPRPFFWWTMLWCSLWSSDAPQLLVLSCFFWGGVVLFKWSWHQMLRHHWTVSVCLSVCQTGWRFCEDRIVQVSVHASVK